MRTWIEINLDFLKNNMTQIQKQVGKKTIMSIIKADAYGHGAFMIAKQLNKLGIRHFGVACSDEAFLLKREGIKGDILILSPTPLEELKSVAKKGVHVTISSFDEIRYLYQKRHFFKFQSLNVHLKIDTGMGRIGFDCSEILRAVKIITRLNLANIEGIYSHLSDADSNLSGSCEFTLQQISKFDAAVKKVLDYRQIKHIHILNSAGILNFPTQCRYDNMVRPGLIMYGVYPSDNKAVSLAQILTVKTKIVYIKHLKEARYISYNRTYLAEESSFVATLPIGYADGIFRQLSNNWQVKVGETYCDIIGRICMDQLMILANSTVKIDDTVEVIGENLSIYEMSKRCETIPYEILVKLNPRITRFYYENNRKVAQKSLLRKEIFNIKK